MGWYIILAADLMFLALYIPLCCVTAARETTAYKRRARIRARLEPEIPAMPRARLTRADYRRILREEQRSYRSTYLRDPMKKG